MFRLLLKSKKSFLGIILAIIVLGLCKEFACSSKAAIILAGVLLFEGIITFQADGKKNKIFIWFYCCISIVGALFIEQFVQNESILQLPFLQICLGIICIIIIYLLFMTISGSYRFSICSMYLFVLISSTVNDAIYQFRGAELLPADLLSVKTALNVADGYHYAVGSYVIYGWIMGMIICFGSFCLQSESIHSPKNQIRCRIQSLTAMAVCLIGLFLGGKNVQTAHFLKTGTVDNGFLLNFTLQIKEAFVSKPQAYNSSEIIEYTPIENSNQLEDNGQNPDIIVIMNESFSDLSVLGEEVHTDIPVMPYYNSLTENTIKGYALSSVFGGGTPNSEYEFLTGNTLAFLPEGSIVYQQFLKDTNYSILGDLKARGYETFATHPYLANGWLRDKKWSALGFDEYTFVDSYQQENMLRELVSDDEMYDYIINHYEDNYGDKQFIFGVTMQNHGAYNYENPEFEEPVHLIGYENAYPDVEQYLSLVHASDKALKKLISYFSEVERPVIILFYGDHLPSLDQAFYQEVHGGDFEGIDETECMYRIPFALWANYDINEKTVERTSINYLSNYLYEAAGLSDTPYNKVLREIEAEIPAINSRGYYSNEDNEYKIIEDAVGSEAEILHWYNCLEYNCMFDTNNRNLVLFPIPN